MPAIPAFRRLRQEAETLKIERKKWKEGRKEEQEGGREGGKEKLSFRYEYMSKTDDLRLEAYVTHSGLTGNQVNWWGLPFLGRQ
jgi:hypothetical protein